MRNDRYMGHISWFLDDHQYYSDFLGFD